MEILRTLATLLPLAVSSGLNLYATVLIAGLCIRFGLVQNAPAGLQSLAAWPVIIVAGILYAIEFLADKIPLVDNAWDVIHTFVRPLGGALLAAAALGPVDPVWVTLAALLGGSISLASHAGKAGNRVALNVISPAENASNIGVSLIEDVAAGALTVTALKYPLIAGSLAVVVLAVMALVVPRFIGWAWLSLTSITAWMTAAWRRALGREERADTLPPEQAALLAGASLQPPVRGRARGIRGGNGRSGYLSITDHDLVFTYPAWGTARAWRVARADVTGVELYQRFLLDILEVSYRGGRGGTGRVQFAFMRDCSLQAAEMARRLQGKLAGKPARRPPPLSEQAAGG